MGAFSLLLKLQFGNLQPEIEINEYSSTRGNPKLDISRILS